MKLILAIIIIVLIGVVSVKSNNNYEYMVDDDSYNLYTLSFDNLSTNNFLKYFSDFDVVRIYPHVNPIYKSKVGNISYKLNSNDLSYEINLFKNNYLSLIKKNSYLDYNYLFMNGINIDKIDVYINSRELYKLINYSDLIIDVE